MYYSPVSFALTWSHSTNSPLAHLVQYLFHQHRRCIWRYRHDAYILVSVWLPKFCILLTVCTFTVNDDVFFPLFHLQVVPVQRCRHWHHEQGRRHASEPRTARHAGVGGSPDQQEAEKGNNQSHASDWKNHLQVGFVHGICFHFVVSISVFLCLTSLLSFPVT